MWSAQKNFGKSMNKIVFIIQHIFRFSSAEKCFIKSYKIGEKKRSSSNGGKIGLKEFNSSRCSVNRGLFALLASWQKHSHGGSWDVLREILESR